MANTINKSKKPRSKRGTVRLRHKIEKAAASKQRKARKQAKKDPTWRSSIRKDPGIPNLFPYKEKLLHEIEQRKLEMEARKREPASSTAIPSTAPADGSFDMDTIYEGSDKQRPMDDGGDGTMDIDENSAAAANPMAALLSSARAASQRYDGDFHRDEDQDSFNAEGGDVLETGTSSNSTSRDTLPPREFEKTLWQVVEQADIILHVLDARDPEGTRSRAVERKVIAAFGGYKRLILVLNKVDLVPTPVLRGWTAHLRQHFPTFPLHAAGAAAGANTFTHKDVSIDGSSAALVDALKAFAASQNSKRAIRVGVVGYPNVGKSSVINALLSRGGGSRRNACPAGAEAGVTTAIRAVKFDSKLTLLDSPGVCFPAGSLGEDNSAARLVLLNAVPLKQVTDPVGAVSFLLKKQAVSDTLRQNLFSFYDTPPLRDTGGDVTNDFLLHVARKRGRLGRGGIPNLSSAAMAVVIDWRDGRIQGWAEPPAPRRAEKSALGGTDLTMGEGVANTEHSAIVAEWASEFKL